MTYSEATAVICVERVIAGTILRVVCHSDGRANIEHMAGQQRVRTG